MDVVILLVVSSVLFVYVKVSNYFYDKHKDAMRRAAENFDIGEGITLLEGVQAYWGGEVDWYLGAQDDMIRLLLTNSREDTCYPAAGLIVEPKAKRLKVYAFKTAPSLQNGDRDPDELIGVLIQAAKDRRNAS